MQADRLLTPFLVTTVILICCLQTCNSEQTPEKEASVSSTTFAPTNSELQTPVATSRKPTLRKKIVRRVKKLLGHEHESNSKELRNDDLGAKLQASGNELNDDNRTSRRRKLVTSISKTLRVVRVVNPVGLARSGGSNFRLDWSQVKDKLCFWCDSRSLSEEDEGGDDFHDEDPLQQNETNSKILAPTRNPKSRKPKRLPHQNSTQLLLFTRAGNGSRYEAKISKYTSLSELRKINFNLQAKTVLLIHGFRGSTIEKQLWCTKIKDMILARERANVFYVDWHHHARVWNYYHALNHVPEIAQDIYEILLNLSQLSQQQNATATTTTETPNSSKTADFLFGKTHAIGHSLGAHVAGLLGQLANGKLRKITALDPAGFALESRAPDEKLSGDDARNVVAYHTDKYLGYARRVAQQDIYVNGGSEQPACQLGAPPISTRVAASGQPNATSSLVDRVRVSLSIAATCDHRIVRDYMSTFMGKCIMMAYLCPSYEHYESGQCGFCAYNSSSCLVFGFEWQYEPVQSQEGAKSILSMAGDFVGKLTGGFSRSSRQPHETYGANVEAIDQRELAPPSTAALLTGESTFLDYPYQRYYVKTGAERPYCLFIYQVVVRFANDTTNGRPIDERRLIYSMSAKLSKTQTIETSSLSRLHKLDSGKKIDVFDSRGQMKTLQGGEVFTGLNTCDKVGCGYYDLMPIKFKQFNLRLLPVATLTGTKRPTNGKSELDEDSDEGGSGGGGEEFGAKQVEVYVNFMSHYEFKTRAKFSGPLRVNGG